MNSQTSSKISAVEPNETITVSDADQPLPRKSITLLDGRVQSICIGEKLPIHDRDGQSCPIYFEILDSRNRFHTSLFSCLSITLTTHSLVYNSTTTKALRAWLSNGDNATCETITLRQISSILEIPPSYRAFIIPILRRVKEYSLPGLSAEVIGFLDEEHKWEQRDDGSYYTLITNDPEKGALTNQELLNVQTSLNQGYASRQVSKFAYTLCWFFIGTGVRPVQVARMKRKDVIIHDREALEVTLKIPLAKGQGAINEEYWVRKAPTVLAECLISYLDMYTSSLTTSDDPLFKGTPNDLSLLVTRTLSGLPTYSERQEGPIHISPYRFRYTLATRAIAQGASDADVARLLTHRSTSCIRYYRASMPQLQAPIRQALGREMDYFASAFQGRLIDHMDEATRAGDDSCVIADYLRLTGEALGACGTRAECHQHAPIACLSCPYFEPLIDAPWETLLATLIEDQELETEPRIKQINTNAVSAIHQIMVMRDSRNREE